MIDRLSINCDFNTMLRFSLPSTFTRQLTAGMVYSGMISVHASSITTALLYLLRHGVCS